MQTFPIDVPTFGSGPGLRILATAFHSGDEQALTRWALGHRIWPGGLAESEWDEKKSGVHLRIARPVTLALAFLGQDPEEEAKWGTGALIYKQGGVPGFREKPFPEGIWVGTRWGMDHHTWRRVLPPAVVAASGVMWTFYLVQLACDLEVRIPMGAWTRQR